jgi:AcrR family transcriptional regulator
MTSEDLWRAALHDFNNLLAGLQGVLDLSDPQLPFDERNRLRLATTLEEGKLLINMARALALGSHPDPGLAPWREWKAGLEAKLEPMSGLFKCPIRLMGVEADGTYWPAPLLQEWAAAFTRQVLPWAAPGPLSLEATASPEAWTLTWVGDAPLPMALRPDAPPDEPRNLHVLWLRAVRERLDLSIEATPEGLVVRMARPWGATMVHPGEA